VVIGTALPMTILNLMILGPVAAALAGATHVSMDRIDAAGVAEWLAHEPITNLALVPSIVRDLLADPDLDPKVLSRMRHLVAGAAVVPEGLSALYEARFGKKMTVGYGLTESPTGVAGGNDDTPDVQGAIGVPLVHVEVGILDENGDELPRGESGEICFRAARTGPLAEVYSGPLGYWRRPEATAELLAGGWVHTGDVGRMDETGQLFIEGRRSELIIRGGANIYPAEVERVLRMDKRVKDCAVLGKADARLGEIVAAFVETNAPADQAGLVTELRALCEREIAAYKIPVEWRVVDELPRNAMGKVVKPLLRERLEAEVPA
jgi:long-chain acyl-CoA synthetase